MQCSSSVAPISLQQQHRRATTLCGRFSSASPMLLSSPPPTPCRSPPCQQYKILTKSFPSLKKPRGPVLPAAEVASETLVRRISFVSARLPLAVVTPHKAGIHPALPYHPT